MLAALLAYEILGVELGELAGCATLTLHLLGCLALSLVLGLEQLLRGTQVGDAALVDGKLHLVGDVVLAGVGLVIGSVLLLQRSK